MNVGEFWISVKIFVPLIRDVTCERKDALEKKPKTTKIIKKDKVYNGTLQILFNGNW